MTLIEDGNSILSLTKFELPTMIFEYRSENWSSALRIKPKLLWICAVSISTGCNAQTSLSANESVVRTNPPITTREMAVCRHSEDRPVCMLQLISRNSIIPFRSFRNYRAKPELLELIEGASGENVRKKPNDAYEKRAHDPFLNMLSAENETLRLDRQGVPAKKAFAPILMAAKGYKRQQLAAGQIQLESTLDLRIGAYSRILQRYKARPAAAGDRPTLALTAEALRLWEKDLNRRRKNSNSEYKRLANAYGYLNDRDGVKRVLAQTDWDQSSPLRVIQGAIYLGDYKAAWTVVRDDRSAPGEKLSRTSAAHYGDLVFKSVKESGDLSLTKEIASDIAEVVIEGHKIRYVLPEITPFLSSFQKKQLAETIEIQTRNAKTTWDGGIGTAILAWNAAGDTARATSIYEEWIKKAKAQPSGLCSTQKMRCPRTEVERYLARQNRLIEAVDWTERKPYDLFEHEVRSSNSIPSTLPLLLESGERVAYSLRFCVKERAKYQAGLSLKYNNIDAAAVCARTLYAYSQTAEQIRIENNRIENAIRYKKGNDLIEKQRRARIHGGRFGAAESISRVAYVARAHGNAALSEEMLTLAFNLWDEAPEIALANAVKSNLQSLSELELVEAGRL